MSGLFLMGGLHVADKRNTTPDDAFANEQFTRLFTVNQRALYLYIRSLVANSADVDEIWGDTNLVLWQRFADFQPGTSFLAWAQRIAYNKILNYRTRRPRPVQFSNDFLNRLSAAADDRSRANDLSVDSLNRCAEKLSFQERELLQLRYGAGATCQTMAQLTGRSVNAIYNALTRIRAQLLACIQRELAREDRE